MDILQIRRFFLFFRKNRRICKGELGLLLVRLLQIRRFFLKNGKFGTSPMQMAQNCDNPNRSGHPLFLPHNIDSRAQQQTHLPRNLPTKTGRNAEVWRGPPYVRHRRPQSVTLPTTRLD